ncbi:hypothetical protein L2E82_20160 [Cichorium intybus]|nr:hypothetical protein L2E82_20160 [Cichorium intybus]
MSGPECCANPPEVNICFGKGCVEEIGGLKAYITGDRSSSRAILLASDAFGYEGVMLRKLANKIGGLGYMVVVPDFFFGDYYYSAMPPEIREKWLPNNLPVGSFDCFYSPDLAVERGCENALKIIAQLKSSGSGAVGAAGFCWGGMMVTKLAKYEDIKAAVILHPGPLTDSDVNDDISGTLHILWSDGSKLVVPMDILDRWFKKFQERAKPDPAYLKGFAL